MVVGLTSESLSGFLLIHPSHRDGRVCAETLAAFALPPCPDLAKAKVEILTEILTTCSGVHSKPQGSEEVLMVRE
jgi:hypothetical protein